MGEQNSGEYWDVSRAIDAELTPGQVSERLREVGERLMQDTLYDSPIKAYLIDYMELLFENLEDIEHASDAFGPNAQSKCDLGTLQGAATLEMQGNYGLPCNASSAVTLRTAMEAQQAVEVVAAHIRIVCDEYLPGD